jgi:hypothetical protein
LRAAAAAAAAATTTNSSGVWIQIWQAPKMTNKTLLQMVTQLHLY